MSLPNSAVDGIHEVPELNEKKLFTFLNGKSECLEIKYYLVPSVVSRRLPRVGYGALEGIRAVGDDERGLGGWIKKKSNLHNYFFVCEMTVL